MRAGIEYISVEEARRRLFSSATLSPSVEIVSFSEAYGRVLAEDIVSEVNIPAADMAHHDGYAVRAADIVHASAEDPVSLKVVGEVTLGQKPTAPLRAGEAWRVPTGGFLPPGSDAVVMKEAVKVLEDGVIQLVSPVSPGESLVQKGLDVKMGEVVLKRGGEVRAQDVDLLATLRRLRVKVARKPVVAVLSVGNELVDRVEHLTPGKIFSSHANMVCYLVEQTGGVPMALGVVSDDEADITRRIRGALQGADVLLTIGGTSVGRSDYVPQVVDSLGKPGILFRGLKIHPGRMGAAAVVDGKPVVLLPGLIQSTAIVYFTVGYPLLRRMLGVAFEGDGALCGMRVEKATMAEGVADYSYFKRFKDFEKILFLKLQRSSERSAAYPLLGDTSLFSIVVNADAWTVIPEGKVNVEKGEEVVAYFPPALTDPK